MINTSFNVTNVSDASKTLTYKALGLVDNYALKEDEPTRCVIANSTSPLDAGELISFSATDIKKVTTDQDILYPAGVTAGVQYQIRVEDVLSTTSDTDASFRVDQPVVMMLTVRQPKSSYVSDEVMTTMLQRLMGAVMKSDGSTRFSDLARSSLKPTVD